VDKKKKEAAEAASATAKATFTLNTGYVKWMAVENKNTWRYQTHIDSRIFVQKEDSVKFFYLKNIFVRANCFSKFWSFKNK